MLFHETGLSGAYLIDLEKRGDERGFFARQFCQREFAQRNLTSGFVQVNNSASVELGTLRGMHYQRSPYAETKMVRCIRGAIWDCILDLRSESPTFGKWFGEVLSDENRRMMYVPKGFAHGFISLTPHAETFYFVDEFYSPQHEGGVRWNDPLFAIKWPGTPQVLSDKDRNYPNYDTGSVGGSQGKGTAFCTGISP